jgi:hypothetical protein
LRINIIDIDNKTKPVNTRVYDRNNEKFKEKECYICMTELIDPEDSELSDFVIESTCCNGGLTSHLACFSKLKNPSSCNGCRGKIVIDFDNIL